MGQGKVGEVTAAIADFVTSVSFENIPRSVVERAKLHILDTLGLALAGSVSDASRIAREHLAAEGLCGRGSVIFGTSLRAPPRFSAFANAASSHADNFDDTTPQVRADRTGGIHASGAVLPAVLALAETTGAPGRDVIAAYLTGVEVSSRLNHAIDGRHYADGFHTTGTLNVFGAAAAAAQLKGLARAEVVDAIALAASRASGVRRNFGTMAEILHSAHAAEDGIAACDLAGRGLGGAMDALDGPTGYFAASAGAYAAEEIVGKLGNPWVFEDPGVWIKPHPNGALTHPGAGALLSILKDRGVNADDISRIGVQTNERVWNTLQHHDPQDGMQAKFSMEYTLAIIAVDGRAGLGDFSTQSLNRLEIRSMMDKIDYVPYAAADPDFTNVTTLIDVELQDGRSLSERADFARGSTRAPMSADEVIDKFEQCAAFGGHSADLIPAVAEGVDGLEHATSIRSLVNALISKE